MSVPRKTPGPTQKGCKRGYLVFHRKRLEPRVLPWQKYSRWFLKWCTFLVPSLKITAPIFLEIFLIQYFIVLVDNMSRERQLGVWLANSLFWSRLSNLITEPDCLKQQWNISKVPSQSTSHTHRNSGRVEALARQDLRQITYFLFKILTSVAAQHSPPKRVLTKLSWGPTLCAAWVGMYRHVHVTSRNQGTFSR